MGFIEEIKLEDLDVGYNDDEDTYHCVSVGLLKELQEEDCEQDHDCECNKFEQVTFLLQSQYSFLEKITSGDKQCVYRAKEHQTQQEVCIKIIFSSKSISVIPMEIRMLEYIRRQGGHPNIQSINRVFRTVHSWIIVSPLYDSEDLSDVPEEVQDYDVIFQIMKQLMSAIHYLHSINIIHADVKLANIIWDFQKEHLILCDFDLAVWKFDQGHTSVIGTDGFIAPEVYAFERDSGLSDRFPIPWSELIDYYSAGCVLGCLLFICHESDLEQYDIQKWRVKIFGQSEKSILDQLFLGLIQWNPENRIRMVEVVQLLDKEEDE